MIASRAIVVLYFLIAAISAGGAAHAQAVILGQPTIQKWQIGYVVTAEGGALEGVTAYATVPMDWPEQKVRIESEEVSPAVKSIRYRTVASGARQMIVSIPRLAAGETATALVTFEIEKAPMEAPQETDGLRVPARAAGELRGYLLPGPAIESQNKRITSLAAEIDADDSLAAWDRTGALFDWVRENVQYEFDEQLRGALAALDAKQGDCEELTALFVAFCRSRGIPARSVWVPGHCYPEFYLEDEHGKGHWFPCQAAGEARDFGRMNETRPILQKGDNFKVPGERKPQHYVHEKFEARNAAAAPRVEFVRKLVE
jgi:hypothetical protein